MAIRTHEQGELQNYFDTYLPPKRSRLLALFAGAEDADLNFEIRGFKIPFRAKAVRYFARPFLRSEAARRWLSPNSPCVGVDELEQLQRELALTDVDLDGFAREMKSECIQISRAHPELSLWIRRRLSLLDFVVEPPKQMSTESVRVQTGLHLRLLQVVSYAYGLDDPAAIAAMADELSATALDAAAQEVCSILGNGPAAVNANLMVPLDASRIVFNFNPGSSDAVERASRLWQTRVVARRCLMVVAETERAGHLGFWVPLARGAGGSDLPGAPTAFFRLSGDAVFKDDLPDLIAFPQDLGRYWQEYIHTYLHEDP